MGAAESPDRKRRRHDSPEWEQHREGDRHRSRHDDAHDRPERAGASSRHHHDRQHDRHRQHEREEQPVGGSSRHHSDSRDRQHDRHRDRSRERERERDRQREREREQPQDRGDRGRGDSSHRQRERDPHDRDRERDRYGDGSSRGGKQGDRDMPGRGGREGPHGGRDGHHAEQQQQREREQERQRPMGPPRQQEHTQREGRGGGGPGSSRQRQRDGGQEEEGRPKWGKPEEWAADEPPPAAPKEGPNLGLSGKLAAETNKTADGTSVLKFQAPAEARVCKKPVWKLFVYKGEDLTGDPINLTQMPFYMFGKDRKIADIPTDHPSCSRQHAVLVFREVTVDAPDGISYVRTIKPYLLDLETTNGTYINSDRLEAARYYELLSSDVIRFGFSSREYVIMNEAVVQ